MANKGLCVDDVTLKDCPHSLPALWPNSRNATVTSFRLIRPWHQSWGSDDERLKAWSALVDLAANNNAKVLIGTEVTCDSFADDTMWQWNLELMKMLGKDHIMGVSIGNEMDIFGNHRSSSTSPCHTKLWEGQYWDILKSRIRDLDANGFEDTKVTITWAMSVLGALKTPFREDALAKVNTLVTKASARLGSRWVWSFNIYPMWSHDLWPASIGDCRAASTLATQIEPVKIMLKQLRQRIHGVTGNLDDTLWIGGTGWSFPLPKALHRTLSFCPSFNSLSTFKGWYKSFLAWDLSLGEDVNGPDHVFYFAIRDSSTDGFGLINSCASSTCKVKGEEDRVDTIQLDEKRQTTPHKGLANFAL